MRRLFIASPCICRSEIHNICFDRLLEYLKPVAHVTTFIVNIDPCSGKNNETQEETEQNLQNMFKKYNVMYEIYKGKSGCFFSATKRILSRIHDIMQMDKTASVLWFEDDKLLTKDPIFKGYLEGKKEYVIHFWRKAAKCPTFHPCLWSGEMARNYLIKSITNEIESYDPELLMMNYWRKNFKNEIEVVHFISFSKDIGREWQKNNNIKKWVREDTKRKSVTYV